MVELILVWAVVVSIGLALLGFFLIRLQKNHKMDIEDLTSKHKDAQTKTMALGRIR